ncbi:Hypothetical protein DB32_000615 [Sandaracinus amylolyticus]|uniref:FAS1 domain-containing protein n=1 Tax=Sandaracinus amylolyticus TaxID=927083 RepID=A0A0F6YG58_9BACT|nr:Hypothetical protein DB32_000615 [Sandaracinus amylolyticus]
MLGGLWACGDDDGGGDSDAGRADAGTDAGSGDTIADIAAASDDFDVLVAAASRAGLVDTLSGTAEFTVFAPTDAAFVALLDVADEAAAIAAVEALGPETLAGILTYHALSGTVTSSELEDGPATTVSTLPVFVGTGATVTINGGNGVDGGANVTTADIAASNGVIHVIDRVLVPPTVADVARYAGLTTLAGALASQELVDDLEAAGPFTVFAPTNAAFSALGALPSGGALTTVLLHHVVSGSVASSAIPARASSLAESSYGDPLTLLFDDGDGVVINGAAEVVIADLRATNGVVHVVDAVITPMNVVQAASAAGLTGLLGAVEAAADLPGGTSVADALAADAPYTVFAPTNDAFAALSPTPDADTLRDVLLYHVLSTDSFDSPVLSTELPTTATGLETLNGADIPFVPGPPATVDGAEIVIADIVVTNGVVHVIDTVMLP